MGETLTMRQVGDLVRSGRLRFEPYATERDGVPVTGTAVVLMDSGRERDAEWREPCCPRCRALSDSELLMVKRLKLRRGGRHEGRVPGSVTRLPRAHQA
jgi:hypothetical protein